MSHKFTSQIMEDNERQNEIEESEYKADASRHWVQDLFPPAFGYTLQEIIDGKRPEGVGSKTSQGDGPNIFAQLAEVMSPADAAKIQNVYRRVWVMMSLKKKSERESVAPKQSKSLPAESSDIGTSEAVATVGKPPQSCIWTPTEIEILREEFQSTKDANKSLRAENELLKEKLLKLLEVEKTQRMAAISHDEQLNDAKKANIRYKLLSENLKFELDRSMKVAASLRVENSDIRSMLEERTKELERMRTELNAQRLQRDHLELAAADARRECELQNLEWEERLRRELNARLRAAEERMRDLHEELEKEKVAHRRTLKGLEQLRVHFCSLPSAGEFNSVGRDQVTTWTYN